MKIRNVETFLVKLPFTVGGELKDWKSWNTLNNVLVRIDTDSGISGWGDAFGYGCAYATKAAVDKVVAPLLIGRDATDIAGTSRFLQQANHIWGRYGVTMFAIGGVDIALWDIAGKAAGLPLHRLLGGKVKSSIPAYASLFKYQDPKVVGDVTKAAVQEGYRYVKLHETTVPETRAAREAAPKAAIMLDTNCPWSFEEARRICEPLSELNLHWLEEPIWPPEDFETLNALRVESGIPIAAGENACTSFDFKKMLDAEAVDYVQPSVTKVGGITEFRKVMALAEAYNSALMPHSPYFGPGFLATLHLMATWPGQSLIERFYTKLEASYYGAVCDPVNGEYVNIPDGPGLGMDPDMDVIREHQDKDA